MKRILFVSNTAGFNKFIKPYMKWFMDNDWIVDNVSSGIVTENCSNHFSIPISRSPFSFSNIKAYKMLKDIINKNNYDIVHCHTPMGGCLARLAVHFSGSKKTKVLYTAHGFHFFKGASIINWIIYYPIEKVLAKYTDCLITINQEDFDFAIKHQLSKDKIFKISGIGADLSRFHPVDYGEKIQLRNEYGLHESDFVIIYVAQFIKRKNHLFLLNALPTLKKQITSLKIFFAGSGPLLKEIQAIASRLGVDDIIIWGGERTDVERIYRLGDIHVSTSLQEGLGMNNVEAMASGLPIVCSNIRGHNDVVINYENGFLFDINNQQHMIDSIMQLYEKPGLRKEMGLKNTIKVKEFSLENSLQQMSKIYNEYM